jgi:hypothetical protein
MNSKGTTKENLRWCVMNEHHEKTMTFDEQDKIAMRKVRWWARDEHHEKSKMMSKRWTPWENLDDEHLVHKKTRNNE